MPDYYTYENENGEIIKVSLSEIYGEVDGELTELPFQ